MVVLVERKISAANSHDFCHKGSIAKCKKLRLVTALASALLFFSPIVLTSLKKVRAAKIHAQGADAITAFYGTYWLEGVKNMCMTVEKDTIVLYSSFTSFSYSNIVW